MPSPTASPDTTLAEEVADCLTGARFFRREAANLIAEAERLEARVRAIQIGHAIHEGLFPDY